MLGGTSANSQLFLVMLRLGSAGPLLPSFPLATSWFCAEMGQGLSLSLAMAWIPRAQWGLQRCWDLAATLTYGPSRWVAITESEGCRDVLARKRAGKERLSHCAGPGINSTEFSARPCAGKSPGPHQDTGAAVAVCANGIPVQPQRCWSWLPGDHYHPASDCHQ